MSEANEATGNGAEDLTRRGTRQAVGGGMDEKRRRLLLATARMNEKSTRRRNETRTRVAGRAEERTEGRDTKPTRHHLRRLSLMGQRKNELGKTAHIPAPAMNAE